MASAKIAEYWKPQINKTGKIAQATKSTMVDFVAYFNASKQKKSWTP